MGLTNLPLFSALADKMRWHQERQSLLAQNIANAETPGYRGQDLKPFTVDTSERPLPMMAAGGGSSDHLPLSAFGTSGAFGAGRTGFEITPDGNQVTLEDEMMKVTGNQLDYQAATTLYSRSMRILKVALGRSA